MNNLPVHNEVLDLCSKCGSDFLTFTKIGGNWETAEQETAHCEGCNHAWIQPNPNFGDYVHNYQI